jgi:hypothetical protein
VVLFKPQSLIDGDLLSWIARWGSTHQVLESCWWLRYRADVGSGVMLLSSHACNGIAEFCWWWRCRGDIGHGVMSLSSQASDDIAKAMLVMTRYRCRVMLMMALPWWHWSWHDVTAESCWRWCHWVLLVMALPRRHCPWRNVAVESCWRWRYQGDMGRGAMSLSSHVGDDAAESCWRWHYRGDVGRVVMSLISHATNDVAKMMLLMTMLTWHLVWSAYKYWVKRK